MLRSALGLFFILAGFIGIVVCQERLPTKTQTSVTLRYLGAAGWEISDGSVTVLIDPYVSRINGPPPPGGAGTPMAGDTRLKVGWDDIAASDVNAIDTRICGADFVLVTHTHYDHVLDVPQIALRKHAT